MENKYPPSITVPLLERQSAKGNRYWEFRLKGIMMQNSKGGLNIMLSEIKSYPKPESTFKPAPKPELPPDIDDEEQDIPF